MPSSPNTPSALYLLAKSWTCFSTMCPLGVSKPPRYRYDISKRFAEPCASLLQLVQLVIIQHSHFTRMTTYDLQMFNDTDVPVVEHLCMASIFCLPPTSSVQQHFGVRLLWLSPALCAPGRGGGGCGCGDFVSNISYDLTSNSKCELNLLTGETMTSSQPRRRSKPGC